MPNDLRILSGTVHMRSGGVTPGSFTINFYPFELGASEPGTELKNQKEIGVQGRFINAPATIVTPRQFTIADIGSPYGFVNIHDTVTRDSMTVDWVEPRDEDRVFVEEVPFMVIGEVAVTPIRPPIRGGVVTAARRRARTAARRKAAKKKR